MADLVPRALLDGVVSSFDPVEVYLFGSRARGDNVSDSDYDLFVVVDDAASDQDIDGRAVAAARRAFRGPVDIVMSRRSNFERRRARIGTLAEIVASEGVRVYGRPSR